MRSSWAFPRARGLTEAQIDRWLPVAAVILACLMLMYSCTARADVVVELGDTVPICRWEVDLSDLEYDVATSLCVGPQLCVFTKVQGGTFAPNLIVFSCSEPPPGACLLNEKPRCR